MTATPHTRQSSPSARSASASPTASPSPVVEKSRDQVVSDFRFASEGIGEEGLRVVNAMPGNEECQVDTMALSPGVPDEASLLLAVERLQKRGWRREGVVSKEEGAYLKAGTWAAMLGVGAVPENVRALAGSNKGAFVASALGKCDRS